MRRIYLAAGALLLGTSALAVAAGDSTGKGSDESTTVSKSIDGSKDTTATSKLAWWNDLDAKLAAAGLADKGLGEKTMIAKADTATSDDPAVLAKLAAAEGADGAAVRTKLAMAGDDGTTGMGGPLDEGGKVTSAELTPRPATMNYPPCDPGPGDDRCIQLYEPGVRAQPASWNHETGGLLDHSATTAMGGPYEPVDGEETDSASLGHSAAMQAAMNGDGSIDVASGETAETELAHADANQGMGGPIESQSGYPPCDPGPGDDRCIQLYEPGVTGAGN